MTSASSTKSSNGNAASIPPKVEDQATEIARILFESGAVWNDIDTAEETAACIAWRLGLKQLYRVIVEAGVLAEVLLNRLAELEDSDGENGESDGSETTEESDGNENSDEKVESEQGANLVTDQLHAQRVEGSMSMKRRLNTLLRPVGQSSLLQTILITGIAILPFALITAFRADTAA
jgi:hypothetical protein